MKAEKCSSAQSGNHHAVNPISSDKLRYKLRGKAKVSMTVVANEAAGNEQIITDVQICCSKSVITAPTQQFIDKQSLGA